MIVLKTYPTSYINSGTLELGKLDEEIQASGFVTNYIKVNESNGTISVYGDAMVDESGLDNMVAIHDDSDPARLLIQSLFDTDKSDNEVLSTDITLLGMDQSPWDYSRGARTIREYKVNNVLYASQSYSYVMANGNRDIGTISYTFHWMLPDQTEGLAKATTKTMTVKSLGELNQEIRRGRMTDLRENAKAVAGGQGLIDSIYSWYGTEISDYENIGSLDFENALINEADAARLGTLNFAIAEFGGLTIMQLLAFQLIGAYEWA